MKTASNEIENSKEKASKKSNDARFSLIALGSPSEDFEQFPQKILEGLGNFKFHFYKSIEETFENLPEESPHLCLVDGRGGTNIASEWSQALRMAHPEAEIWVLYGAENPLEFSILKKNGARQVFHLLFDTEFFINEALTLFSTMIDIEDPPLSALESISADDFDLENEINFNVYVHLPSAKKTILVRKKGTVFDQRIQENAKKTGQALFVKKTELKPFFEYARTVRTARNEEHPTTLTESLYKTKKNFYQVISILLDTEDSDFTKGKEILAYADKIFNELGLLKLLGPALAYAKIKTFLGKPPSLYQSALNVCAYSACLGEILEKSPEDCKALATAGLFHNIGLSQMPISTFKKIKKDYSPEELESFKYYPERSVNLVKSKKVPLDLAATNAILEHAENADGSGIPKGKLADDTDELAKIVRLALRLDELTSNRSGHTMLGFAEAIEFILKESLAGKTLHDLVLVTQLNAKIKTLS